MDLKISIIVDHDLLAVISPPARSSVAVSASIVHALIFDTVTHINSGESIISNLHTLK